MRMVSLLSFLCLAAIASVTTPASAARTGIGLTITDITVIGSNARIYIRTGVRCSRPGCTSASHQNHFGIDVTTDKGRAQLSIATAAMLSGKTINLTGYNTCIAVDTPGTNDWQELNQISMNP